jgi:ribonuclease H / adenosylcobalamin/alpha-ribazole phosphatase
VTRFVVEADGGSRGNPGPAAYGTVVRDGDTDEVLREIAEHIGTASNNVAEYRGLIAGLEAVRELDPTATVEARLDSKLVVEQMSGRWKIKHPGMRELALRARDVLAPSQVTYTWVPREQNKHADRLANEALDAAARGERWSESASTAELDTAGSRVPPYSQPAVVAEAEVEPAAGGTNRLVGWDADLGAPTTVLLLRHGQTRHTEAKLFSGSGGEDPPLTAFGEEQARAAADLLAAAGGVDAVVSSPMRRARQTADVVAGQLGLDVREVDDLRECAFGEWEGLTFAEVRDRWPDLLAQWLADPTVAAPGGESFEQVRRRVEVARDKLLARYAGRTVLVVTHVTPVKMLVRDALGAPISAVYRMELSPASLTEIQWYAGGTASLRRFNDAAHLP